MTTAKPAPSEVARAMFARDCGSRRLGMKIEEVEVGRARLTMTISDEMVNGHGICHGGFIFTLADSAFAFACNAGNEATVAAGADIVFCRPARAGDVLIAECKERCRYGRSGVYDAEVRDAKGKLIAVFQGRSRAIGGAVIADESKEKENRKK
jgi:acyl-CoA thioesterase